MTTKIIMNGVEYDAVLTKTTTDKLASTNVLPPTPETSTPVVLPTPVRLGRGERTARLLEVVNRKRYRPLTKPALERAAGVSAFNKENWEPFIVENKDVLMYDPITKLVFRRDTLPTAAPWRLVARTELVNQLVSLLQSTPGNKLTTAEALAKIYEQNEDAFSEPYYQEYLEAANQIRWKNDVEWARNSARENGLIHEPAVAGRGVWELTESGKVFNTN
jgi:hypothetical protein